MSESNRAPVSEIDAIGEQELPQPVVSETRKQMPASEGARSEQGQKIFSKRSKQQGHESSGHGSYASKKASLRQFFYDPDTKMVMGRTGKQWFQLLVFYIVFYAALVGFWVACVAAFLATTTTKEPTLQGFQSVLQLNPAIGYRPQPDVESNLIKFNASDPRSFNSSLEDLKSFLKPYVDINIQGKLHDCKAGQRADYNAGCKFEPQEMFQYSKCLDDLLGYSSGMPCVVLKMNRIYGWMPKQDADGKYQDVKVRCEGEFDADKENIGALEYAPGGRDDNGSYGLIYAKYFPFLSQPYYLSPIVMVRFRAIQRFTIAMVWCTFDDEAMNFAPGVFRSSRMLTERAGGVHFEILVDDVPRR